MRSDQNASTKGFSSFFLLYSRGKASCDDVEHCVKKFRISAIQRRVNHQNRTFFRWYQAIWNKSSKSRNFRIFEKTRILHQQNWIVESKSTIINFLWRTEVKLNLIRHLWIVFCSVVKFWIYQIWLKVLSKHLKSHSLNLKHFVVQIEKKPWIPLQLFMEGTSE